VPKKAKRSPPGKRAWTGDDAVGPLKPPRGPRGQHALGRRGGRLDGLNRPGRPLRGRHGTACGRSAVQGCPPDCAGPLLPGQGRPRSFLRRFAGSAGSFVGLFPGPASRCDPCGRLCGGGVNPPPSRPGDTGPPAPLVGTGQGDSNEHQHTRQQHHQPEDRRAGQARRAARADQRGCRGAGGLPGVAGDAGHRGEVPQLQRWRSWDIRSP